MSMLRLDPWMLEILEIDNIVLYINPHSNTDYVVCQNDEDFFVGGNDNGEYDASVYEHHHPVEYRPITAATQKRKAPTADVSHTPFKKACKKNTLSMSNLEFVIYFKRRHCEPTEAFLGSIYTLLRGVDITSQTLNVVDAAIHFIYTKTLQNTMRRNCERKNKLFKRQLQYVLSHICK